MGSLTSHFKPLFFSSLIKMFFPLLDDLLGIVNNLWLTGGKKKEEETFSGKEGKMEQKRI